MKRLLSILALALMGAGPPQVMQPQTLLDSYGRLLTVPTDTSNINVGLTDLSVVPVSNVLLSRYMVNLGNEFTLSIQGNAQPTSGTQSYEKAGLYVNMACSDPSDNVNGYQRDCVGVESQATIKTGNLTGRAWAFDSITTVQSGADGYASGVEITLNNSGSDQAQTGLSTSKNGMHLVGAGTYGGTAALVPAGAWHDGLACSQSVFSGACLRVISGSTTLAQIAASGAATFPSLTLNNGGTSTGTFTNFCVSTTGTPFLGGCIYGANNVVSGQYSVVGGNAATDQGEYGRAAFASTAFGHNSGDSQMGWYTMGGVIPSGGGTVRLAAQNGATASALNTIKIGVGRAVGLDCTMVAHAFGGQDSATWALAGALFDEGATASTTRKVGGAWVAGFASSGAGVLTPSIAADTTLGTVNMSVTAASGGPWDITARCFSTEVR